MAKSLLAALVLVLIGSAVVAQTIGVYGQPADLSSPPSPRIDVPTGKFDIVVVLDEIPPGGVLAYELWFDWLPSMAPGVFAVGEIVWGGVDLGNEYGEYILSIGFCHDVSSMEPVRVNMHAVEPLVSTIEIGICASSPTSVPGATMPVILDCRREFIETSPRHRWQDDRYSPGSLVINPDGTEVSLARSSFSTLKSRY